ncbi:helix-turn-helix domain-containing protein [Pseudomonas aeruginosa]|uniref:helix-turn-helix transcriptional regulator n=1 Tax=Pseudomonas aeruginosa TaxID=287 RepID=UPI000EADB7EC|nr:helix-turn-helix domain-containing protein [Pseudomonas aeruginosa]EME9746282.1 helix-turn-helix domain-containing protein [Pseudomonas aeruginosa]MDY1295499.1 helix-turn-helix domain-containing protein [Pseudomonas aeruginosa]MDY1391290.1 helix-turn-helix domain-containing protein [Pseudomonas aeruginosa]TED53174.1 DNA-binding protein [Pseudomonas aeruginosa]UVW72668.1 helix-turn-helix domain-containing protein [Pseudomonas aeruginosa]
MLQQQPFLTNAELCQLLRCSQTTLWRLRRDIPGFPQPCRLGRRLLWNREQVEQAVGLIR